MWHTLSSLQKYLHFYDFIAFLPFLIIVYQKKKQTKNKKKQKQNKNKTKNQIKLLK